MSLKSFFLSHEPFRPAHMGYFIRSLYFKTYVRRIARDNHFSKILDAGCGTGMYTRLLARWFPAAQVFGIDLHTMKEWRDAPSNVTLQEFDLRLLDAEAQYDLVVSIDVLEHIPNNGDVIRRLIHALRSGGFLYIAVPSETEEQHFLPRSLFSQFHEWEEDEHIGEQHTLKQLSAIVAAAGAELILVRHTFTFFGMLAWEIEMALHWRGGAIGKRMRILLMPLLKGFGFLDILFPIGTGNNLVIARKR